MRMYRLFRLYGAEWGKGGAGVVKDAAGELARFGHRNQDGEYVLDRFERCWCCKCQGLTKESCCKSCKQSQAKGCIHRKGGRKVTWGELALEELKDEAEADEQAQQGKGGLKHE